jgi:hypothetical protein
LRALPGVIETLVTGLGAGARIVDDFERQPGLAE